MALDLQGAGEQREGGVVPDGTYVRLQMVINPGGLSVPSLDGDAQQDQLDNGIFTQSASSDVVFLECEMTVVGPPPWQNHKLTERMTIYGGRTNPDDSSKGGNQTRASYRAMINSACALDPKDDSPQAQQTRRMRGYMDLSGIEFWARLSVEPGSPAPNGGMYPDKNRLDHVVVPGEPEYAALAAGQEVPPMPRNRALRVPVMGAPVSTPAGAGRAWGNGAAAPAAAPAPAQPPNRWATPTAANNQATSQPASAPTPTPAPALAAAPAGPKWLRPAS